MIKGSIRRILIFENHNLQKSCLASLFLSCNFFFSKYYRIFFSNNPTQNPSLIIQIEILLFSKILIFIKQIKSEQNQTMHYGFKSTPTISFKSRNQTITKSNQLSSFPSPFQYEVKKPLPKAGTIAQTKQKRQLWKKSYATPGPGSYQPKSYITDGVKRTMSARYFRQPMKTPGPLEYVNDTIKVKNKTPVYSMGRKSKSTIKIIEDHNKYKPGPNNYEQKFAFSKTAGVIFGSSHRKDLTETERTPAPNFYKTQQVLLVDTTNPRCKVGSEKRQLKIAVFEKTPGPGTYQKRTFLQQNKQHKKGFTCRQKVRDLIAQELARHPAPNQYKSQLLVHKPTAPRCSTTQTKRRTFIDQVQTAKKDLPAFSNSDTNFFNNSKFRSSSASVFGRSNRRPLDQNQTTPGPLAYSNEKLNIMDKKPSFSCPKQPKGKNEFLKVIDPQNPGPTMYNSKLDLVKQKARTSIILKEDRPNFDKQKQKPGPGYYNLRKDQKPKFGYTKEARISFTDLKNQAKHATHYNLNTNFTNPPSYMKVQSKVQFSPSKSLKSTGF